VRRKVLRGRSVGIRLTFLGRFGVEPVLNGRLLVVMMLLEMLTFVGGVCMLVRGMSIVMSFFLMELFVVYWFLVIAGASQRFTRE
jgi:hypothetical protein